MKYFFLANILFISLAHADLTTYKQIQQQEKQEADQQIAKIQDKFITYCNFAAPCQLGIAALTGISTALTVHAIKNNNTKSACLFSGFTAYLGYGLFLTHSQLIAFRAECSKKILDVNRTYRMKINYLHKRNSLNDIAKFQMNRLEEILKRYIPYNVEVKVT